MAEKDTREKRSWDRRKKAKEAVDEKRRRREEEGEEEEGDSLGDEKWTDGGVKWEGSEGGDDGWRMLVGDDSEEEKEEERREEALSGFVPANLRPQHRRTANGAPQSPHANVELRRYTLLYYTIRMLTM
ncbi:hypothetical protein TWF281_005645 [Arthrobotrys megalospora]